MSSLVVSLTNKDIERIFSKISIDSDKGCWLWNGALNTYGYGETWFNRRMELTHRLLYAWMVEPLPQGIGADIPNLDHFICDNPRCCNPAHLKLVLPKENLFRGNSVSSVNARKTHCIRGHLLPNEPNRSDRSGRTCVICRSITNHARYISLRYGKKGDEFLEDKRKRARKYYKQSHQSP